MRGSLSHREQEVSARLRDASALHRRGQLAAAQAGYDEVLKLDPDHADALYLSGVIATQSGRPDVAMELIGKAIAIDDGNPAMHFNHGLACHILGNWQAALSSYERSIALDGTFAGSYSNRALVLKALGRLDEALASSEIAVEKSPEAAEACFNRAVILHDLRRFSEALTGYDRAIALRPDYAEAFLNRGNLLSQERRWSEALANYDRAVQINPTYVSAYANRGTVYMELGRWDDALASFERALDVRPDYAEIYCYSGEALTFKGRYDAAVDAFTKAISLKPALPRAYAGRLRAKIRICDWTDYSTELHLLTERILRGETADTPFSLLALLDSAALQKAATEHWAKTKYPSNELPLPVLKRPRGDRIRVGYFSADFYDHATMYLLAELFELHDRSRFHITAFSFGSGPGKGMLERLRASCEEFVDVADRSDQEIALLARQKEIDIAADLKGFTTNSRPGIFAARAAPLQVGYLGYPGTTGTSYIDYLIADPTIVPADSRCHYSEKILYLPDCYQINDSKRAIAERSYSREELGLPSDGFVFCCFNNSYKIQPATFDIWMRLLARVTGSVLWLLEDNTATSANLRREAERRGVAADRLVFARRLPLADHLARHRAADLFIDTSPCNAHTTASDALWAGLPVLTLRGESFAGRVASSLLKAAELGELITESPSQYEELAFELAMDRQRLDAIQVKLRMNRLSTALFNSSVSTKHLEMAYLAIFDRHQARLPVEHVLVKA